MIVDNGLAAIGELHETGSMSVSTPSNLHEGEDEDGRDDSKEAELLIEERSSNGGRDVRSNTILMISSTQASSNIPYI